MKDILFIGLLVFFIELIIVFLVFYFYDHFTWKPYITKGTKVKINKLPHWF